MPESITWHRPEYRDQLDLLISLAEVAELAGVTRAAVSNWRHRHDFPTPAMTAGRTVWVVLSEAEQWLAAKRTKRDPASAAAAAAARLETTITALENRERRQAAVLAATRKNLRRTRAARKALQA